MKKTSKKPKTAKKFDSYFEDHDIADLLDSYDLKKAIDKATGFRSWKRIKKSIPKKNPTHKKGQTHRSAPTK